VRHPIAQSVQKSEELLKQRKGILDQQKANIDKLKECQSK
jgi:hypothetical protein